MKATTENTIFVTTATERNADTCIVMATARKFDVFVHFLRSGAFPPDFWGMKIEPLHDHLKRQKELGKEYFVFFDTYDVFFLAHREEIIKRLNDVYDGRMIFCADYPGALYPYTDSEESFAHDARKSAWLIDHIQSGDMETSRLLNAGLFAGRIDDFFKLHDIVVYVKQAFVRKELVSSISDRLYEDLSGKKLQYDDQMSFWMTMLHHQDLFRVDGHKEFLSVAATKFMLDDSLESYRKVTRNRPLKDGTCIGNALILHSAGGDWRNMGFVYRHRLYEPMPQKRGGES